MNKEALVELKRVLKTVIEQKKGFDLDFWRSDCGTVCCAIGWATQDAWFKEHGLVMKKKRANYGNRPWHYFPEFLHLKIKKGEEQASSDCLLSFFEFQYHETTVSLFLPAGYNFVRVLPERVIERIDLLLKEGEVKFMVLMNTERAKKFKQA